MINQVPLLLVVSNLFTKNNNLSFWTFIQKIVYPEIKFRFLFLNITEYSKTRCAVTMGWRKTIAMMLKRRKHQTVVIIHLCQLDKHWHERVKHLWPIYSLSNKKLGYLFDSKMYFTGTNRLSIYYFERCRNNTQNLLFIILTLNIHSWSWHDQFEI